ncbi:MAG: hypothetical protein M0Z66_12650 [Thermaerobacter sp.]|nr:hypothetical protein [Thermaerobacter sp.]
MGQKPGDWEYDFPAKWEGSPTAAELAQQGTAVITVTLNTYPLRTFPKGTVWHP